MSPKNRKQRKRNKAILRRAFGNLGNLQAEHDPQLPEYYVDSGNFLKRAVDIHDPAIVFKGPKGIGKSAILKMVETRHPSDQKRLIRISPDELMFTALANAHIENSIIKSATTNQWLLKSLWNYVLSVRLLAKEYPIYPSLIETVMGLFRSDDHKLAKRLITHSLNESGKLSLTETLLSLVDEISIVINTQGIEGQASVSLRDVPQSTLSQAKVLSLVDRVAQSLPQLLKNQYFVLIDDLDLHWQNDPVQNALIASLFSAMAKLRQAQTVKFLIAIRDDIYKYLPIPDKDKSRDWICELFWDRQTLKKILERRMNHLHGISPTQLWEDLLPDNAFDTMLENSHATPRELIRQLHLMFATACEAGHSEVTKSDMEEALRRNAREKIEELEQQVGHTYPDISWVLDHFQGQNSEFSLTDLQGVCETMTIEQLDNPKVVRGANWACNITDPKDLAFYLIDAGILLVKTSRQSSPQELTDSSSFRKLDAPWFAIRSIYRPALLLRNT